ncbi:MAG: DUF4114 domain-containing protein [Cyanobacteria bacterium P01_E01_bin.42]
MTVLQYIQHWLQQFFKPIESSQKHPNILLLEPILTPSYIFGLDFGGAELMLDRPDPEEIDLDEYSMLETQPEESVPSFIAGFFTAGSTGIVAIEFPCEYWSDRGEMAIFSLAEMEKSISDINAFIGHAAWRSASNSPLGYTLTRDRLAISSTHEFDFQPGDRFGIMFVSEGKIEDLLADPHENTPRPLFSLATEDANDDFLQGQIVDLTGGGHTFMMEDLRLDGQFQGDLIFKIHGAIGQASTPDRLCA